MSPDQFGRQVSEPSIEPAASDENSDRKIGSIEPGVTTQPISTGTVKASTEPTYTSLLPDLSNYDLTVGEALAWFKDAQRKLPSTRTLQRYCQEGRFDCYKLKTTRNGNPVNEWIINSTSLRKFIQTKPKDGTTTVLATPEMRGDAIGGSETQTECQQSATVTTTPKLVDDASDDLVLPRSSETEPDAMTTPNKTGDAISRAELLIENARLTARLEAQEDLVDELRDDKRFLREEITQHRRVDQSLAEMHRETLQTLKAVSLAGRHTKVELPGAQGAGMGNDLCRDVTDSEQNDQQFPHSGV